MDSAEQRDNDLLRSCRLSLVGGDDFDRYGQETAGFVDNL